MSYHPPQIVPFGGSINASALAAAGLASPHVDQLGGDDLTHEERSARGRAEQKSKLAASSEMKGSFGGGSKRAFNTDAAPNSKRVAGDSHDRPVPLIDKSAKSPDGTPFQLRSTFNP